MKNKLTIRNIRGKEISIPKHRLEDFLTDFENFFRVEIFCEDGHKNNPQMKMFLIEFISDIAIYQVFTNDKTLLNRAVEFAKSY